MVFTSLLPRGYRPRGLVRMDVEHAFLIHRLVLVVEIDKEDTQPEERGGDGDEVRNAKGCLLYTSDAADE